MRSAWGLRFPSALLFLASVVLGAACSPVVMPSESDDRPLEAQERDASASERSLPELPKLKHQAPEHSEKLAGMIERWRAAGPCPEGVVDLATRRETLCWIPCRYDEDCPDDEACMFIISSVAMDFGYRRHVPSGEGQCLRPFKLPGSKEEAAPQR